MKKQYLLFLSVFLLSACEQSSNQGNQTDNKEIKIDYDKYTLDNGLDIILHQDKSDPIVAVAILFHVGSNREKVGRTGFAHFFEHMLFQASENVGKGNFFKVIEELGGDFNGGTWNDGTIYYEVVPKNALEKILWMESDRMGFMINTVTEAVFENEKQVVKNEKRQRVDNQPYGHTRYVIDKALYPENHPYNWQVIGSLEDLEKSTIADVKEFYEKWYGPNNATMVIAGDFETAEAKAMIEKYFGEIPRKGEIENLSPQPTSVKETIKLMHEDNFAQLPELNMIWPTVEDGNPDAYALDYLGELLSDGKRAPLYKEVVENQKLAPSTSSYNSTREIAGTFQVRVRANKDTDLNQVQNAIFQAMENFEKNGIDDRDMERIKYALETDFYGGLSSLLVKSWQLAQYNEFRGSPDELQKEIKKILAVSKEDVMRVYQKYIKGKPYVMTSFVPKGQADLAVKGSSIAEVVEETIKEGAENAPMEEKEEDYAKTPSKIDRSIIPPLGDPPSVTSPTIWEKTLSNSLSVLGIPNNELPLVEFSLRIKGGLLMDDPTKIGVANLITDVMQEGTKNKSPEELEDAIGQLGATLNMRTTDEYIAISGSCLSKNYEAVMALVQEMILEPRWDESEFSRIKQKTLAGITQAEANPNSVGRNVFMKLLYGKDHILSNRTLGTQASLATISMDDLKTYYNKNFSPNLASYQVAGAVTKKQVLNALKGLEEGWENKEIALPRLAPPKTIDKPVVYFVDIPDSKQSIIRIGAPSVAGNSDEYFATTVVNQRLGDGSSGRLFQQLREEKGYTYGAYSFFPRRINPSYFGASSSVRSNVTTESVQLFKEILERYQADYNAEDLEKTKSKMLRSNALAYETLGDKLGILHNISTYGLPLDYMKKEDQVVRDMDLAKAKEVIGKFIDPSKMIYIVIGDAKTQYTKLKNAGLGDPILIDKDAEPVKTDILN